ncbi:MAG: 4Fe-4S dicluster-binding protein [Candidatus Hodarchaeales archaeon]
MSDHLSTIRKLFDEKWGWKKLPMGTVIPYPGSAEAFNTGDWAAQYPHVNEKCTSCLICYFVCPDSAIDMPIEEDGKRRPKFNTFFCKGCALCAYECPVDAIEMQARDIETETEV